MHNHRLEISASSGAEASRKLKKGKKKKDANSFVAIGTVMVTIGGLILWSRSRDKSGKPKDPRTAAGMAAQRRLEVFPA